MSSATPNGSSHLNSWAVEDQTGPESATPLQVKSGNKTKSIKKKCFPHATATHAQTEHAADWPARKLFLCRSSPLPMSGTDLGQSWLMGPQLPGGFLSGGSNACSLTVNTNTVLPDAPVWNVSKFKIYSDVIIVGLDGCEGTGKDAQWSDSMASAHMPGALSTPRVFVLV